VARSVSLLPITVGFLAVAACFVGVEWALGARNRAAAPSLAGEALVLTLLATLWFKSLGHGGWLLLFLLLGLLAAAGSVRQGPAGWTGLRRITIYFVTRYIIAGGLLALIVG
jgi:hypothetical protein